MLGSHTIRRIVFYEPGPRFPHVFARYGFPRLGAILLGTILKEAGYDVGVYVDNIRAPEMQDFLDADLVCITTITSTAPRAYEVAAALCASGQRVVIGGSHVTFMPEEGLQHCDYVFRGEAENSILQLVEAVGAGEGLELVPGLSFKRDGEIYHNRPAEPVLDLDTLPAPDFSLLQGDFLDAPRSPRIVPVSTSRGCPYNCFFCSVTEMFGRKYRFRSPGRVLEDLVNLDPRCRSVFFCDDHFAADRSRLHKLLEGMLSRGVHIRWAAQIRGDVAKDEQLVRLMRRAGCRTLYIGMESANPETLKAYNKRQTVSEIEHSIEVLHKHGIRVNGMFCLGADTDTVETLRATSHFARRNRLETAQFLILTPLPGTQCYRQLKEQGRLLPKDWSYYDTQHVVFEPANMSPQDLQREAACAVREFYSLPRIAADAVRLRFFEAFLKWQLRRFHLRVYSSL